MKETSIKRNNGIDFFRGLAAISVIFIHTVFHSGNNYVPLNISCYSLLFDIPVFMCIAGMTLSFSKSYLSKIDELINLFKKWLFFGLFCFIYLFIFDREELHYTDLFPWLVLKVKSSSDLLISLQASMSFFTYYIQVTIFFSLIIFFIRKSKIEYNLQNKFLSFLILILFFILISLNYNVPYLGLNTIFVAYSFFYCIGYLSMSYTFKSTKAFIAIEILFIAINLFSFYSFNYDISHLQNLKMSMNFLYPLISLPSLFLVIYLRDKFEYSNKLCQLINFVGKNAIFMFFAQGLSSSLLFKIVSLVNIKLLGLKIFVMFVINIIIAILFFVLVLYFYKLLSGLLKKIIEKCDIWNFLFCERKAK